MSNVPTPNPAVPRPAVVRKAPPPLKTDAMDAREIWEAYAASPPIKPASSRPPPLPPASPASALTHTVMLPKVPQLSTVVMPVPAAVLPPVKAPPKPPFARRFALSSRKAARIAFARATAAGLVLRRGASGAWTWSSAHARAAATTLAPKARAATAPRFSLVTLVLVLVAAWGGAFAAGLGARMQKVEVVAVPALQAPAIAPAPPVAATAVATPAAAPTVAAPPAPPAWATQAQ